jgi:adenylate kinase
MGRGGLVPDYLINEMVAARLLELDTARGYILEGFPRKLGQADWLSERLDTNPDSLSVVAVRIEIDQNQLLGRITGRMSCPVCQAIYNIHLSPPKTLSICDIESAALVQRADDTEDLLRERMCIYSALTAPVVERYRASGQFAEVDGDQPIRLVTAGIVAAVERLRS